MLKINIGFYIRSEKSIINMLLYLGKEAFRQCLHFQISSVLETKTSKPEDRPIEIFISLHHPLLSTGV